MVTTYFGEDPPSYIFREQTKERQWQQLSPLAVQISSSLLLLRPLHIVLSLHCVQSPFCGVRLLDHGLVAVDMLLDFRRPTAAQLPSNTSLSLFVGADTSEPISQCLEGLMSLFNRLIRLISQSSILVVLLQQMAIECEMPLWL
jgi:hypothetical protein